MRKRKLVVSSDSGAFITGLDVEEHELAEGVATCVRLFPERCIYIDGQLVDDDTMARIKAALAAGDRRRGARDGADAACLTARAGDGAGLQRDPSAHLHRCSQAPRRGAAGHGGVHEDDRPRAHRARNASSPTRPHGNASSRARASRTSISSAAASRSRSSTTCSLWPMVPSRFVHAAATA
jgi:hypothetical protein